MINEKEMTAEMVACKEAKIPSDKLVKMWQTMIDTAWKQAKFKSTHVEEDCKSDAMLYLLRMWINFNPEKSYSAWSFCYTIIKSAFIYALAKDKRERLA